MPICDRDLKLFVGPIYVETGSWDGDGIAEALSAGFGKVISIEAGEAKFHGCRRRFKDDPRVTMVFGTSQEMLWDVIKDITIPIVFFLDAHFCGNTGYGSPTTGSPLFDELNIIALHPIRSHTLLIDDMRCFRGGDWQFGDTLKEATIKGIEARILQINPEYAISYMHGHFPDRCHNATEFENDILVAKL